MARDDKDATEDIQNEQIRSVIARMTQCVDKVHDTQVALAATTVKLDAIMDKLASYEMTANKLSDRVASIERTLEKTDRLESTLNKLADRVGNMEKLQFKLIGAASAVVIVLELMKFFK
jgi:type II secretory pathway component PulF